MSLKEQTGSLKRKRGGSTKYEYFTVLIYAEGFSGGNPSGCDHALHRDHHCSETDVHDRRDVYKRQSQYCSLWYYINGRRVHCSA